MIGMKQRLTFANVMSFFAVFVVLGGGAFAANEFAKLKKNSVGTKQIKNNAVKGAKVKDNSLTGSDIDASTLGKVPTASTADNSSTAANSTQLGGEGPAAFKDAAASAYDTLCDPAGTLQDCVTVTIDLPHAGPVQLTAAGGYETFAGAAEGTCQFRIDGGLAATPALNPGNTTSDITTDTANIGLAMTTVTGNLPAGNHAFALACNQTTGDMEYNDTTISAMLAG